MRVKRSSWTHLAIAGCLGGGLFLTLAWPAGTAVAQEVTPEQLKTFDDLFMEQVKIGDALFHGDPATEKKMRVKLSETGMACAMCHPFAADTHPAQYPKWQEQMSRFATLREMINWCIEKPNQGEAIDTDGQAMKALETYITWSNRKSPLDPGTY